MRRALAIDEKALGDSDPVVAADRENLAAVLETSRPPEAIALYRRAAESADAAIQARCFGKLAHFEEARDALDAAAALYRKALAAEEAASGKDSGRVAVRLNDLALLLQAKDDFRSAEPLLRRALLIQEVIQKAASAPDRPER